MNKKIHRTAVHGTPLDIDSLRAANAREIALGNAKMNAQGDIIGQAGEIVQSREEIVQEYYSSNPRGVQHVNLQSRESMMQVPMQPLRPDVLQDGQQYHSQDPNFYKQTNIGSEYENMDFKSPEQVIKEAMQAQERARDAAAVKPAALAPDVVADSNEEDIDAEVAEAVKEVQEEISKKPKRTSKKAEQ